jgi:hypothetical protein
MEKPRRIVCDNSMAAALFRLPIQFTLFAWTWWIGRDVLP